MPRRGFRPRIDVVLAGVDPADVHIVVDERALLIAGHRRRRHPEGRLSYHLLEMEYGLFERRIGLPEHVDPEGARAVYERGLLVISLPVAAAPPRRERVSIQVRTST